jgi:hypothetical protein
MDPEDPGRLPYQLSAVSGIRRPYGPWMQRGIEHMQGCCIALDWLLQMSVIRFGEFELDEQTFELRGKGKLVRVQQQPARVLAFLLTHQGKLDSRQ